MSSTPSAPHTPDALELGDLPVVDNHCHGLDLQQQPDDQGDWRSRFTESPHARMRTVDAADTTFYRRLLRRMASFHSLDPEAGETAVLEARQRWSTADLTAALWRDAGIDRLVVDTGYPPADRVVGTDVLAAATGGRPVLLLRLELLFQHLVAQHASLPAVLEALDASLHDLRSQGFAGLKSIVGYRTGLEVERWDTDVVESSFAEARHEVAGTGVVRLGYKPLLDTLLHGALSQAAVQELPVQFHVGYGDPDVDLRTASPLALRAVFEEPAYRGAAIVLLHGCWPYVREGAYLTAVYQNAYLDLSYGIPFLSVGELTAMTSAALGAAPFSKLMFSSDGARVPELHWMGAHDGRLALSRGLGLLVEDRELSTAKAYEVAERVLAGNARRLYGVPA